MANAGPPGSPPSTHDSRKNEEKNVDDEEIFDPSDDEIIDNYLKKRVEGQLPPTDFIKEADDAFTTSPAQLFHKYGMKIEDKGYFFSPLKESVEMKIATNSGFWKYREDIELSVIDVNGFMKIVGRTKALDFFEKNQANEELKTNWVMQEYSLQPNVPEAENPSINKMEVAREEKAEGGGETEEETKGGEVEEEAKTEHENAKYMSLELQGNIPNKVGDIVLCKISYDTEKKSETEVANEDIYVPSSNVDILNDYLNKSVEDQLAPSNSFIDTDDAFISPVELFRRHGIGRDEVGLLYSPLKKSFERRIPTDDGFWKYRNHMFTVPKTDVNGIKRIVLRIKPLDYFEINQEGEELKTNWVMEEHSLPPDVPEAEDEIANGILVSQAAAPNRVGDLVLCKIRYDNPNLKKSGSQAEEVEEDEEEAQGEGEADKEEENQAEEVEENEETQGEGEADNEEENQRDDDNVDAQTASASEDVHHYDTSPQQSGYTWRKSTDDDNVDAQAASSSEAARHDYASPQHSAYGENQLDDDDNFNAQTASSSEN